MYICVGFFERSSLGLAYCVKAGTIFFSFVSDEICLNDNLYINKLTSGSV